MTDILQAARSYYGLADTESCATQLFTNQAGQTCVAFEIPLSNEDFAAIVQRMQNMQQPDTQPDTEIIEGPTVEAMREAYNALSKAEKGRYGSFARYMGWTSDGIVEAKMPDPYAAKPEQPLEKIEQLTIELENKQLFENIEQLPEFVDAVEAAWVAGYYHAGYTNDAAYAHMKASEYFKLAMQEGKDSTERHVVHVDTPEEPEPTNMDAVWLIGEEATTAQRIHSVDYNEDVGWLVQWAMLTDEQKQKAKHDSEPIISRSEFNERWAKESKQ